MNNQHTRFTLLWFYFEINFALRVASGFKHIRYIVLTFIGNKHGNELGSKHGSETKDDSCLRVHEKRRNIDLILEFKSFVNYS